MGFYGARLVTSVLAVVVTKARSQSPTLKGHWALVTSLDLGNVSGAQINEGTAHNLSASFERVWSSLDLSPFTFTFTCRRRAFVRAPPAFLRCKLLMRNLRTHVAHSSKIRAATIYIWSYNKLILRSVLEYCYL